MKLSNVPFFFVVLLSVCSSQFDGEFNRGPWCFPGPPGINCQKDATTLLEFSYGGIMRDGVQFMRFTLINYNDKWISIGFADSTTGNRGQMVGVHAYIDGIFKNENKFRLREYTLGTNSIGTRLRGTNTSFINYVSLDLSSGPRRISLFQRSLNTSNPQHFNPIRFDGELCFLWAVGTTRTIRVNGTLGHSARGLFCDTLTRSPTTSSPALSTTTDSPSRKPSGIPSIRPTLNPTTKPSSNPSLRPTKKPTGNPTSNPTQKPTKKPTSLPTAQPTEHPTARPTTKPTQLPTNNPTKKPSAQPTTKPTGNPVTTRPTNFPTTKPTEKPSSNPTKNPTPNPTTNPTKKPTPKPTSKPTENPTTNPTKSPVTSKPTNLPTMRPTKKPTTNPTGNPTTTKPTKKPTFSPSANPTNKPTQKPTKNPSRRPSVNPTHFPVTSRPLFSPTQSPSTTKPTKNPSSKPTLFPTLRPTRKPSNMPFPSPTQSPSRKPTTPTQKPTKRPTQIPTVSPTFDISVSNITDGSDYIVVLHIHLSVANYSQLSPNEQQQLFQQLSEICNSILDPSVFGRRDFYVNGQLQPSTGTRRLLSTQLLSIVILSGTNNKTIANEVPQNVNNFDRQSSSTALSESLNSTVVIVSITSTITVNTKAPSTSHSPTNSPSLSPTVNPTKKPSLNPSLRPTEKPTKNPTSLPTDKLTNSPSLSPTVNPTKKPSLRPTENPTARPTNKPSSKPTSSPSKKPSAKPTSNPTMRPSNNPQMSPTRFPTFQTSLTTLSPTQSPTQGTTIKDYSRILQYIIHFNTQTPRSLHKFLNDSNFRNRFEFTIRFSFEERADNISVEIVKINDNYPRKDYLNSYQFPTTDLTTHFKVIANIKILILDETVANSYTQDMRNIVNRVNYKENFKYGIGYNIQWRITITYLLLKTLLIGTGAQRKETDPIIFGMELTWPVVVGTAVGLAICCFVCGVTCLYCIVKEKLEEVGEKSERTQRGLEFPNSPDGKSVYLPDTPIMISEAEIMMKIRRDNTESSDSESDQVTGELI